MKNVMIVTMLCAGLVSCDFANSNQAYGTMVGADVGAHVGSIIGGTTGGARGDLLGTVIGAVAGAAIGNAVTAPKAEIAQSDTYEQYSQDEVVEASSQTDEGCIEIRNLRFVDSDGSKSISCNETCKVIFDVRNICGEPVVNITPMLKIGKGDENWLDISDSQTIDSMEPGESLKYTAYISTGNKIKKGSVSLDIYIRESNSRSYRVRTFSLPCK